MVSVFYEDTRTSSIIKTILLSLSVAKELFKIISEEAAKQCSLQDTIYGFFYFLEKTYFVPEISILYILKHCISIFPFYQNLFRALN